MRRVFPYPTLSGDVTVQIGEPIADDAVARGAVRDADLRLVDVSNLEKGAWSSLRLPVVLIGPPSELRERMSNGSAPAANVIIHCGSTNTRQSVDLTSDGDAGRWRGDLLLERPHWFGRIEVRGFITETVGGVAHRIVGIADSWSLLLDDLPRSPAYGSVTVLWRDFEDNNVEPALLARAKGEPYYHHLDPAEPILFLNLGFPGLEPLLRDRLGRRAPAEQALHDQVRSSIATKFFLAASNAALAAAAYKASDEASFMWPESEWQEELLRALLARMYPKRNADDAFEEVMALLRSEDTAGDVEAMLVGAVDKLVGANRLLGLSIRQLGLEPEDAHDREQS